MFNTAPPCNLNSQDLSDNYFEGPIPESFQDANILNSASDVTLGG